MIAPSNTKELLGKSLISLTRTMPYRNITVKQIASNCGLTTRTFYNYFRDKNDLVGWIYEQIVLQSTQRLETYVDWHLSMSNLLNYIFSYSWFFRNVNSYQGQNSLIQTMFEKMKEIYLGYASTIDPINDDVRFAIDFFTIGCSKQICLWIQNIHMCPPEQMMKKLSLCIPPIIKKYFM